MKRTIQAAIIVSLILAAGVATAADTAVVNVSARVVGTCKFTSGPAALAFGDLPVDLAGNALGTSTAATLTFWCTKGASYIITDDSGVNETVPGSRLMKSDTLATAEYIAYDLAYAPAAGTGAGPASPVTLNLTGTVGTTYAANSADTYSDTVTLTITP